MGGFVFVKKNPQKGNNLSKKAQSTMERNINKNTQDLT